MSPTSNSGLSQQLETLRAAPTSRQEGAAQTLETDMLVRLSKRRTITSNPGLTRIVGVANMIQKSRLGREPASDRSVVW
jgi:hypothetical protein